MATKETGKETKEKKEKKASDPRARWLATAPKRITRALKAVQAVQKLARPKTYTWTPGEVEKMVTALGGAFERMEASFRNPGSVPKEGFTF